MDNLLLSTAIPGAADNARLKIGDVVRCEIERIGAIEALVQAPG